MTPTSEQEQIERLKKALQPFAEAADKADKSAEQQKRLMGSAMSDNATVGWGIKYEHVKEARAALEQKPSSHPPATEDLELVERTARWLFEWVHPVEDLLGPKFENYPSSTAMGSNYRKRAKDLLNHIGGSAPDGQR